MSILLPKKNVGDYSYMSSPNIYYRAQKSTLADANYDILIIRTRCELGSVVAILQLLK